MSLIEDGKYLIDNQFRLNPLFFNGIGLYQIGKKLCNPDTVIYDHMHYYWFELTVVNKGLGKIYTNNYGEDVKSGDIYISFPMETHRIETSVEQPLTYSFLSFYFGKSVYEEKYQKLSAFFDEKSSHKFTNSLMPQLLDLLISEFPCKNPKKNRMIPITLEQILILTLRSLSSIHPDTSKYHLENDKILTSQIVKYISNNILTIQNLDEIADYFSYNYSYLSKIFKKNTNESISDYFISKKMEVASSLIGDGELNFTQIASLLNYSSLYTFSKAFKHFFGISPMEYKKSVKKD